MRTESGETYACRIRGKIRLHKVPTTNPIAVGDWVEFAPAPSTEDGQQRRGSIEQILPRRNYVLRQSTHGRYSLHMIAANIDQALLVVTLRQPQIKLGFIDRFLLTTATYDIPTTLVFNKADLYEEEALQELADVYGVYKSIGYSALLVSAATGKNMDRLRTQLEGKTTLISGHSGVGKTSLLNAVNADWDLRTSEVSESSDKGQHTTTFAEMFDLPEGAGRIIDTPGIKEFGFNYLSPQDVVHNFKEIFLLSADCKYRGCLHQQEPHCAVKKALQAGTVAASRYNSYLSILQELSEQNSWERHSGW